MSVDGGHNKFVKSSQRSVREAVAPSGPFSARTSHRQSFHTTCHPARRPPSEDTRSTRHPGNLRKPRVGLPRLPQMPNALFRTLRESAQGRAHRRHRCRQRRWVCQCHFPGESRLFRAFLDGSQRPFSGSRSPPPHEPDSPTSETFLSRSHTPASYFPNALTLLLLLPPRRRLSLAGQVPTHPSKPSLCTLLP